MAIELTAEGSREAVIKHVESWAPEIKAGSPDPLTPEERAQLPLLKSFIVEEIKNVDASFNSVRLVALGNCHSGHRHIEINLIPRKLHLL